MPFPFTYSYSRLMRGPMNRLQSGYPMISPFCMPQSSPKKMQSIGYSETMSTTFRLYSTILSRSSSTNSGSSIMSHRSSSMDRSVHARSNSEKPMMYMVNLSGWAVSFSHFSRISFSSGSGKE